MLSAHLELSTLAFAWVGFGVFCVGPFLMWAFILINPTTTPQQGEVASIKQQGKNQTDLKMDAADSFKEQHVAITFHFTGREGFPERNRDGEQRGGRLRWKNNGLGVYLS